MNYFTEQNFRIAWNQCRKFNYNNYNNFGLRGELEFYDRHIETIIKDIIIRIQSNLFVFSHRYIVYIPKDNGLLRRISITTLEDQLVMQVILNAIGYKIDKKFIKTSYANRMEKKKGKLSTYIFKPYYKQFNKFINSVIYSIERGYEWICETDITAYFDTISHIKLENMLIENLNIQETQTRYMKQLIMDFVRKDVLENGDKRTSERGIPQSMPISSFIGNLYLNDVDYEMMKNQDILYFRYADDIRILGKSKKSVEDALLYLQKSLLLRDLYINGLKTQVYKVDLNTINKEKLKSLQKQKLSIETVTENDFEDVKNLRNSSFTEKDINNIRIDNFNELERMIKRKNKLIKNYLIKKNEKKNFKYIQEIISESPKHYYLVQSIKKYRNKISISMLNEIYTNLIESPYEVISAQGIGDILNYNELFKIRIDIAKVDNARTLVILLQILNHKEYIKLLIRKVFKIDIYSLNIILKPLLLALSKLEVSDKLKTKILNKVIEQDILLSDSYIFIYILFKNLIHSEKLNKYMAKNYFCIYRENIGGNLSIENIYINIKKNGLDLYTIRKIIKKIVENLPDQYIKEPTLINPYNISIILEEDINVKFSNKITNLKNKIPEDFIMESGKTELKITYMVGLLWFCMFVNDSIGIYNNIVPYIQFSPINYWKYNRHEFTNTRIDYNLLKDELNYINMAVKKSPLNRMNIEKILKVKIKKECEDKIMQDSKTNINILHLSDIHFGIEPTSDGYINSSKISERKLVLRKLIKKLKNMDKKWKPNVMVISGDIGWRGKSSDYKEARLWIEELMTTLSISSDHLIICPGNHDLDRSKAEFIVTPNNDAEADDYLSDTKFDGFTNYFQDYQEFARDIKITPYKLDQRENYLCGTVIIDNLRFLILNSAWFSRNDSDKSKLWIGQPLLKILEANDQIEENDKYINIGVLHHTKEWLATDEVHSTKPRMRTYGYLARMTHLMLSGHVHAYPEKSEIMESKSYVIVGGSTYSGDNYSNNCSIIKVDKEKMIFNRTVVEYIPHEGEWSIKYNYESNNLLKKE